MKLLKISFITVVLLGLTYVGAWFTMAHFMNNGIMQFYVGELPRKNVKLWGGLPEVTNFPKKPQFIYENGFDTSNFEFRFNEMLVEGFPIPTQKIKASINDVITFHFKPINYVSRLQAAMIEFKMPLYFPRSTNISIMDEWQREIGQVEITDFYLEHFGMIITGDGIIGLDEDLQVALNFDAVIFEYEKLIEMLVLTEILEPLPSFIALSALNALAETDPVTGKKSVNVPITIQDRQVSIAGFRFPVKLKRLDW